MLTVKTVGHPRNFDVFAWVPHGGVVGPFKIRPIAHGPAVRAAPRLDCLPRLGLGHLDVVGSAHRRKSVVTATKAAVVYDQRASVSQDRELIPWAAVQDVEYGLQAQGFAVAFLARFACFACFLCA